MNPTLRSLTALGWLCLSMLCGCAAAKDQPGVSPLRVMTYNIHHGEGLDGKLDLPRIADLIKREGADIVALQEVDKGMERTARRDLGAELAALTGLTCVFSNNYSIQGGEYGNAVLTRFPVKQATNTHFVKVNEIEQRGLLQLVLDVRGRDLVLMATHIDHRRDDAARWSNVGEIEATAKRNAGKPMILCGDFNDTPVSYTYHKLSRNLNDAFIGSGTGMGTTFRGNFPYVRIDYLLYSDDFKAYHYKTGKINWSDHYPVMARFRLKMADWSDLRSHRKE